MGKTVEKIVAKLLDEGYARDRILNSPLRLASLDTKKPPDKDKSK